MTSARSLIIDDSQPEAYHLVSRCVRRAFLCGDAAEHRRGWIEAGLQIQAQAFAIEATHLSPVHDCMYDNDGKFQTLPGVLQQLGHKSVPIAVEVPDMNAYIERFFGSLRRECLDHIVIMSETHLRHVLGEYIAHYNSERPHQGIGNVTIGPWQAQSEGDIVCDERLGGLLKSFRRAA